MHNRVPPALAPRRFWPAMLCTHRLFALFAGCLALLGVVAGPVAAAEEVILPSTPNLSPDGTR